MKSLQIALVFTMVLQCFGQIRDYSGRRPAQKPKAVAPILGSKPLVKPAGVTQTGKRVDAQPLANINNPPLTAVGQEVASFPLFAGGDMPLAAMPQWVRDLEGSSITGRVLEAGMLGLPAHGGLGNDGDYSNGLRDGWGADRYAPMPKSLTDWINPNTGLPFQQEPAPTGAGAAGHSRVKATAEHNLVKDARHLSDKTVGSGAVSHSLAKSDIRASQSAGLGPGIDATGHAVATGMAHASVKTGGVAGMGNFGVDPTALSRSAARTVDSSISRPRVDSLVLDVTDVAAAGGVPRGNIHVEPFANSGPLPIDISNTGLVIDRLASGGPAVVDLSGIGPGFDIGQPSGGGAVIPLGRQVGDPIRATSFIDVNPADGVGIQRPVGSVVPRIGGVQGLHTGQRPFSNIGGFDIYGNRRT